jgi:selenocysteine lyase/cysteine desulfurase
VSVSAARYLGLTEEGADLVAQTESTTMGLALVYHGLRLGPGQEILTTDHAFYSTKRTLELRRLRDGLQVRSVRLFENPIGVGTPEILASLAAAIRPETRILALTWVHSNTGVKLPMDRIRKLVDEENSGRPSSHRIFIVLDGVHGFGVEDFTFPTLGCDIFIAGCHKWMFGPRGTGIVCATREAWSLVEPLIPTFIGGGEPWAIHTRGGILGYEHQWAMAEAFQFHRKVLGKRRVEKRTRRLTARLKKGLSEMRHIRLLTPVSSRFSSAIVCFDVEGQETRQVVKDLGERGIVTTRSSADADGAHHVRLAVSVLNRKREIKQVLRVLAEYGS